MSSYTLQYKRTYEEWIRIKADRIHQYLVNVYKKNIPIDVQDLTYSIYIERLSPHLFNGYGNIRKYKWKPLGNRFLDFKPSPFIKNFINHLLQTLISKGYVTEAYEVKSIPSKEEIEEICKFIPDPY